MNKIAPKKLLNSKWTAVTSIKKQKHFVITELMFDEQQNVITCTIQAIKTKADMPMDWRELKDELKWIQGWK